METKPFRRLLPLSTFDVVFLVMTRTLFLTRTYTLLREDHEALVTNHVWLVACAPGWSPIKWNKLPTAAQVWPDRKSLPPSAFSATIRFYYAPLHEGPQGLLTHFTVVDCSHYLNSLFFDFHCVSIMEAFGAKQIKMILTFDTWNSDCIYSQCIKILIPGEHRWKNNI